MIRVGFVWHSDTWEERLLERFTGPLSFTHVMLNVGDLYYDLSREGYSVLTHSEVDWQKVGSITWLTPTTRWWGVERTEDVVTRAETLQELGLSISTLDLVRVMLGRQPRGLFCTSMVHLCLFGYVLPNDRAQTPDNLYNELIVDWGWVYESSQERSLPSV